VKICREKLLEGSASLRSPDKSGSRQLRLILSKRQRAIKSRSREGGWSGLWSAGCSIHQQCSLEFLSVSRESSELTSRRCSLGVRHTSDESRGGAGQKQLKCVVIITIDKSRRWKVAGTELRAERSRR
jgi:hypothetical protein